MLRKVLRASREESKKDWIAIGNPSSIALREAVLRIVVLLPYIRSLVITAAR